MKVKEQSQFFGLLFLLVVGALTNIIVHDFFCHEELHHLISPVHHTFDHPVISSIDLIRASLRESSKIYLEYSLIIPADFVPSIFHPPD
ncbi:MAG: hypothetical protein H5U06_08555 [Candidatus Aminicenantes bacterium]|nr:hypothetical protein [Candidatus Aminicenantes bacterium]